MATPIREGDAGERWRPVVGWEGWYEVSSLGNVRRVRPAMGTSTGLLHPTRHTNGSLCAYLCRERRGRQVMIHAIVAAAFLGPRPAHHRIAWRNGDHADNRADNLYYRKNIKAPATDPPRRGRNRTFSDA